MRAQEEGSPSTAFFFVCECWEVEQSSSSRQLCTEYPRVMSSNAMHRIERRQ